MQITIENLRFSYPGDIEALKGISLEIQSGEQVAIVGQNGSGKTTLVKHFNGLLQPGEGMVKVESWDTREKSVAELASRVGYVFQNPDEQLFMRSVKDEIEFGPKNLDYSEERTADLVKSAIDLADLGPYEEENPYDLSPSWRKMVAMASIVAMDTPIIIFDEPTTGQDAVNVQRIANIVAALKMKQKTVITISHDIDFCAENFERIIAMSQGKVLIDGTVLEAIAQDELLASTYVDPPQLTRLGKMLDLPQVVSNQESFLEELAKFNQRK